VKFPNRYISRTARLEASYVGLPNTSPPQMFVEPRELAKLGDYQDEM